jgi:hypothetical protein
MTTLSETAGAHNRHLGVWHRATQALGKLWAKVLALPVAPSAAARQEVPPEYFRFPPY